MTEITQAPLFQASILPVPPAVIRERDLLFEALADQTTPAWRQGLTQAARGALCRAVADLRGIGATPDEIVVLVAAYRRDMPGASLTPSALAKHAPRLRKPPPARDPRQPRMLERCSECGELVGIDCRGHMGP